MANSVSKALTVRLGKDLHAIPIAGVEEVLPALPIESLPNCPGFIRGVIFVRGHLIPVVDAAERLGLHAGVDPRDCHIVCVRVGSRLVGIQFDEAVGLMDTEGLAALDAEEVGGHGMFQGVLEHEGQIVRMLDTQRLVSPDEAVQLAELL